MEQTPDEYVAELVAVFREVRRVLKDDAVAWLNLGDSYAANRTYQVPSTKGGPKHGPGQSAGGAASIVPVGLKPKDLIGIPWRVAFALQADGWWLRQDIVWAKQNPMPESVTDRCTKAHEYVFMLSKSARYYFDAVAIAEPSIYPEDNRKARQKPDEYATMIGEFGQIRSVLNPRGAKVYPIRNRRSVWTIPSQPFSEAHFATMPPKLAELCILAGCPPGGTVLDPFLGAGTTALVADRLQRKCIGVELNPEYAEMAQRRITGDAPLFAEVNTQPA